MKCLMKILHKGKKKKAGFTLVELMIVVIVVGILAAAAIPIYWWAMAKAYSSEAKALLGAIRSVEQIYFAEHDDWQFLATIYADDDALEDDIGLKAHHNKWWHAPAMLWYDNATHNPGAAAAMPDATTTDAVTGDGPYVVVDGVIYGATSPIYNIRIALDLETGEFLVSFDYQKASKTYKVE